MKNSCRVFFTIILLFGNLFNFNVVNAQLKIMPLGDSITEGVIRMLNPTGTKTLSKIVGLEGLTPEGACGALTSGEGGYRVRLGQLLNNKNWDFEFVGRKHDVGGYHEGYAGYMTSDILYILNDALITNPPDVVLIHIGTNDLPWPINPDSCYVNINKIIDIIHDFNPGIKIILAQIIPCLQNIESGVKRYPKIIELNDLLPQIALERSYVTLVDMWHPFVNTPDWETELMSGTWHPNSSGYRLMADKWSDGLDLAIDGRSPMVTGITPMKGLFDDTSFQCTIYGDYFLDSPVVSLKRETGFQIYASSVNYINSNQLIASFNLTQGYEGNWMVRTQNPNKMWSIKSQNIFFTVFTDTTIPTYCVRVNAGGNSYTDQYGNQWSADKTYTNGSYGYIGGKTYTTADPILWTENDPLYQSERYDFSAYRFDVENGEYRVLLHFAEIYNSSSNLRVFNISVEDSILQNYDIYAEVGHDVATLKAFTVEVTDNHIDIELSATKDVTKISAIEVMSINDKPILAISPVSLNYDSTVNSLSFQVKNEGGDVLSWSAIESPEQSWITSIFPTNGNLQKDEYTNILVNVDRAGLAPGYYEGSVQIRSNADTQTVSLHMDKPACPILNVTPTILDFDSTKNTLTFNITNAGAKTLNWNADENPDQSWIKAIAPRNGSLSNGNPDIVTVNVDRTGLTNGNYQGLLQVSSNGGTQNINVNMSVMQPASLSVSPTTLNFGSHNTKMNFTISNTGGSVLQWQANELPEKTWITSISPSSGELNKESSATITVTVDRSGLAIGSYPGAIYVTSNEGHQFVNVFIDVQPDPPKISVSPTTLDFDSTLTSLMVTIKNIGGESLNWQARENPEVEWLASINPISGQLKKNEERCVTLGVNRYGQEIGEYSGNVIIESNDTDVELDIVLTINKLTFYAQRVNCGSEQNYIDGAGNTWFADQTYSPESWGYDGGYQNSTTAEIANTVNDPLFQIERNNVKNYKFDVPNGKYDVFLYFAEIYYNSPGQRLFQIDIENRTVQTNFDVFAEVGRNTALCKKFTTDVQNSQLNIDFVKTGEEPSISAILVATAGIITHLDNQGEHHEKFGTPESYMLYHNYPNPFKSLTKIAFDLPFDADVKIEVYNMLGQKLNVFSNGFLAAGKQTFTFNAIDDRGYPLPSGVYLYQIEAVSQSYGEKKSIVISKKMVIKK